VVAVRGTDNFKNVVVDVLMFFHKKGIVVTSDNPVVFAAFVAWKRSRQG
jgi:hypothetical protein